MYYEPMIANQGSIEVLCGGVFSGKTTEAQRRIRRVEIAQIPFLVFKPQIDTRYSECDLVSHDQNSIPAIPISDPQEILIQTTEHEARVVLISEAQFFPVSIVEVCKELAYSKNVRVIVEGLDQDSRGIPFGPMPQLLSIADYVVKLKAVCTHCGMSASKSQRITKIDAQIHIGGSESYEPRCPKHWTPA